MLRTFLKGLLLVSGLAVLAVLLQTSGFFDRQISNLEPEHDGGLVRDEPRETGVSGVYFAIRRSLDGHFYVDAWINQDPVNLLVDTGASFVVLSRETAAELGYDLWNEEFDKSLKIADGRVIRAAEIVLDHMEVGDGVVATNVKAMVLMEGDVNLLGMSFLAKIGGFSVAGDEMVFEAK